MKLRVLLVALLCLFALSGCGHADGEIFRYDLDGPVLNLDPQFSTGSGAGTVLVNLFEGLTVRSPEGELLPGCAERWEVSPDALTYTFYLREGLFWNDEDSTPLTAGDFYYGLYRLFASSSPSPYAENFTAIENASALLAGNRSLMLGVRALDDRTLQIRLERPDPLFLSRLATPAAYPCNRAFFTECRGRYGLEKDFVLSNGPFSLDTWDNGKYVLLRKNEGYHSPDEVLPSGVNLYIGRGDALSQLEDEKSDLARISPAYAQTAARHGMSLLSYGQTTWCIVFNTANPVWRSALLRQGLARSADREPLELALQNTHGLYTTERFAPRALYAGGIPLTELSAFQPPFAFSAGEGARLFRLGIETMELSQPPELTILIPDSEEHLRYAQAIRQGWQKTLSFYPRLQRVSPDALQGRFEAGDYQAVMLPFTSADERADAMLAIFRSGVPDNHTGYRNHLFDGFLENARLSASAGAMAERLGQAHRQLLADAPVIPLYEEDTVYVLNKVGGIWIYPFENSLYFKYAYKE